MGKYDKEVSQTKKQVEEWIKGSKEFLNEFVTLKKNNLKWEKDTIEKARKLLDAGAHIKDKKAASEIASTIESGKENLDMFLKEGQSIFDRHNKWAMEGPRKSFAAISAKFKFGKPGEEKYDAILKEVGSILEPVSKAIRDTESAWNKDVKFAIETQTVKLKALAKEYAGEASREEALGKQMTKEVKLFEEVVKKILDGVLFFKDKDDFGQFKSGVFDKSLEEDSKQITKLKQKYEQYKNKIQVIADGRAMLEKNLGRVKKSFPEEYLSGAGKEGFEAIAKLYKDKGIFDLNRFEKYYKTMMSLFEGKNWK